MEIRSLHANEREAALALIWETFLRFEAPDYVPEGVRAFRAFIDAPEQIDALEFFGAFQEGELLGVLATSEPQAVGAPAGQQQKRSVHRPFFALCGPGLSQAGVCGYRCRACGGRHPLHAHEVYKVTFRRR